MQRSLGSVLVLIVVAGGAFAAGYVVHKQAAAQGLVRPSPQVTQSLPPIDRGKEASAAKVFCGHLRRFGQVEVDIRRGRVIDASKVLGGLAIQLQADADLYQKAHDYRAADRISAPAGFLTNLETLPELFQIEGGLQKVCAETSRPAASG